MPRAGGSIYRGSFLRGLDAYDWKDWIAQMRNATGGEGAGLIYPDQVLNAVIYAANGTAGGYAGYAEAWETDAQERLKAGKVEVFHQDKSFYGDD